MTNHYTITTLEGEQVTMQVGISICEVCKRACMMHGTKRPAREGDRPTFSDLDLGSMDTAVRKNGEVMCWTCLDAIYRPEREEKVSYREEHTQ